MALCRRSSPKVPSLGFHKLCGGIVYQASEKSTRCRDCGETGIPASDIVAERPSYAKQQTAGKKRRVRRRHYDIKGWSEV